MQSIPFSAFWLRSSVVSVLISLISDTWDIVPHDIKFIFLGGGPITIACYWGPRASPLRYTTAWAWRTPPKPSSKFVRAPLVKRACARCGDSGLSYLFLRAWELLQRDEPSDLSGLGGKVFVCSCTSRLGPDIKCFIQ